MSSHSLPALTLPQSRPARPTFRGALRGELFKLRRNRPTWVITLLGLLFLALVMVLFATQQQFQASFRHHPLTGFYNALHPLQLFLAAGSGVAILLSGARLLGMEYDLGTVRVIFSRGTRRHQLLLAKITALSLYALLLLVGFVALSAIGTALAVQHQVGSLAPLQSLPAAAWENAGLAIAACAVSEFSCVLLSVAMASLLRSVTSGMVLALLFFPVDNGLSAALAQLTGITRSRLWEDATAFLFGPNLNHLPTLLRVQGTSQVSTLNVPAVPTSLLETALVIAAWWVFLLSISMASLSRNDVLS